MTSIHTPGEATGTATVRPGWRARLAARANNWRAGHRRRNGRTAQPVVWHTRRRSLPRQAALWAAVGVAGAAGVAGWVRAAPDPADAYSETDRAAQAALWGAVAYRDAVALGRTPAVIAWEPTVGYVRVTVDRGDTAGCVQFGVAPLDRGFAYSGPAAPVACPPYPAAAPVAAPDVFATDPMRRYAERFTADWMAGRNVDLYAAPDVTLTPPAPQGDVDIDRVTARTVDDTRDVVVYGTAGGRDFALRLTVTSRDGKLEVADVRGGLSVQPGRTAGTLPTPPVTTTTGATSTTASSTTTTAGSAPSTSAPPVTLPATVTTAPADSIPPPPSGAGA